MPSPAKQHDLYQEWGRLNDQRHKIDAEAEAIQDARHQGYLREEALRQDAADIDAAIASIREELGEV